MTSSSTTPRLRNGMLLAVLSVAQMSLIVDIVVVTVALPSIRADLDITEANLQWVIAAYGLTYGGFMITAGRTGDLFGHRRMFLGGLGVFTAASLLAGLAPSPELLFAARALQGVGAAFVSPTALALLTKAFAEGPERNRALGIWAAASSGGALGGSLVGGILTDLVHWRAIFLVNLPISLVVVLGVLLFVRADRPHHQGAGQRMDATGTVLLTSAAVLLVAAITRAAGGITTTVLLGVLVAATLAAVLIAVERRVADPLLPLSMFANPNVRYGNVIIIMAASGPLVVQFFTTIFLQRVAGLSPLHTGIAFVPVTLVILVLSARAGALVARFGVYRMLIAGSVTMLIGLVALGVAVSASDSWAAAMPGLIISGSGAGLAFAPSMMVATTGVPDRDQGMASGLLNTSMQLGGPLGLAVINTVAIAVAGAGMERLAVGYFAAIAIPLLTVLAVVAVARSDRSATPVAGSTSHQ